MAKPNKRRGFTLIEILLVVGFIAVAGSIVYTVFNKIQTTNLVNQEIEKIRKMQSGLSALFASTPTINDVSPRMMYQARIIDRDDLGDPNPSNTGNNTLKSSWGGTVHVWKFGDKGVIFQYENVLTSEICAKFLSGVSSSFSWIQVGNQYLKDDGASQLAQPVAPATIASACAQADTSNTVRMMFLYQVR